MDNSLGSSIGPLLGGWVLCLLLGAAIGSGKGKASAGAWLGALLGPLGILIILLDKPSVEAQARRELDLEAARAKILAEQNAQPAPASDVHPTPQPVQDQPVTDPWGDGPMRRRTN